MSLYQHFIRAAKLGKLGVSLGRARRLEGGAQEQALQNIVMNMASLRGLPQKVGQILSLGELASDNERFMELTESQRNAESFDTIKEWLELAYGSPTQRVFSSLSEEGMAASLGQVHKAQLQSGETVAVKVQYPNMKESLEADLKALGLLASPLTKRHEGFDLNGYRNELRQSLIHELDYLREANTLERFHRLAQPYPEFVIPFPYSKWCREKVLVMDWIEGERFSEYSSWGQGDKDLIATYFLRFFLRSWLLWGEVHGDPHSGNYRLVRDGGQIKLGVFDFGCVKELSPRERTGLLFLLKNGNEATDEELFRAYILLGFDSALLFPLIKGLREVTAALLAPFWYNNGPFPLAQWELASRIEQALGENRWNFRFAGPPTLILFIRALSGLIQYLRVLDVDLNWKLELSRVFDTLGESSFELPSEQELERFDRFLRIRVTEAGKAKVQLTFPGRSMRHLDEVMPPEVKSRLVERGISVQEIVDEAVAKNYPPGDLFQSEEGGREIRIWLTDSQDV